MSINNDQTVEGTLFDEIEQLPFGARISAILEEFNKISSRVGLEDVLSSSDVEDMKKLTSLLLLSDTRLNAQTVGLIPEILNEIAKGNIQSANVAGYLFAFIITLFSGCESFGSIILKNQIEGSVKRFEEEVVLPLIKTVSHPYLPLVTKRSALQMLKRYGRYSSAWEGELLRVYGLNGLDERRAQADEES